MVVVVFAIGVVRLLVVVVVVVVAVVVVAVVEVAVVTVVVVAVVVVAVVVVGGILQLSPLYPSLHMQVGGAIVMATSVHALSQNISHTALVGKAEEMEVK